MIRKLAAALAVLLVMIVAAGWFLSAPSTLSAADLPDRKPDLRNGAYIFQAAGCESCHSAPDAKGEDLLKLAGGRVLDSPFGRFHVPNISPDPDHGIGRWSLLQFANAMKFGVAPDGRHLYPAFPYVAYQRLTLADIIDLKGYLDTLPKVASEVPPHELAFPYSIRRGIGLWKLFYVDGRDFTPLPGASAEVNRGAYLVEAAGHCAECHTARNAIGGLARDRWLAGAPSLSGKGWVPNITPDNDTGIGAWSKDDIVQLLETGFTPEFDAVGGEMAAVILNTSKLTPADRAAMAAYLKSLPPIHNARPPRPAKTDTPAGSG
ncbi:MAG TPA: cytochrome c [Bauldia sp.]|nr:cytochrome c [Bauldia sp.]